jgi:hypothetical protein
MKSIFVDGSYFTNNKSDLLFAMLRLETLNMKIVNTIQYYSTTGKLSSAYEN